MFKAYIFSTLVYETPLSFPILDGHSLSFSVQFLKILYQEMLKDDFYKALKHYCFI
jgi:hypothetical protein